MINARAETVADKAAFRIPYARHRCLLPASGFYEWQALPAHKQPVHIGMADGRPFAMAGLYERWRSPDDEVIDTCTIVTTRASDALRPIHERMPVIIAEAAHARWLDVANPDVADLLEPWSGEPLLAYPVSTRVNAVAQRRPDAARAAAAAVAVVAAPARWRYSGFRARPRSTSRGSRARPRSSASGCRSASPRDDRLRSDRRRVRDDLRRRVE